MSIDPRTARALEVALAGIPGVLGAVVLEDPNDATPLEVQTFVRQGVDLAALRATVEQAAAGITERNVDVVCLEVAGTAGSVPGNGEVTGAATVARPRPRLVSVVIDSSVTTDRHEAHVSLHGPEVAAGRATVGRDPLVAVVAAACDALARDGQDRPEPSAVERVTVAGLDVVIVVVTIRGRPLVGTAVLEDEPEPAAAVRATLDAVNRWYGLG